MALTYSTFLPKGTPAPDFRLPGVDGKTYTLSQFVDQPDVKALVVIFMCNHCPYVIAVQDRINELAKNYGPKGVALIGISSNDVEHYPADSFENMKKIAQENGYVFPYLYDESQEVARAYQAECTPDPYVFEKKNNEFLLRYQGRIDDSWKDKSLIKVHDLANALDAILSNQPVEQNQHASMGCNIKWKK